MNLLVSRFAHRGEGWCPADRKAPLYLHDGPRGSKNAFTLIEMLVGASLLALVATLLVTGVSNALNLWTANESKSNRQQDIRSVIRLMRRDLEQLTLPVDRNNTQGFQLLINAADANLPETVQNKGTLFFQAPVATERDAGDIAVVGYFVLTAGSNELPQLCRLLINPNDPSYPFLSQAGDWLNAALLDQVALPTEENYLQGLLMENVAGLWVTPYVKGETGEVAVVSYDSRDYGNTPPARLEIALAVLDEEGAKLVKAGVFSLPAPSGFNNAATYIEAVPAPVRKHLEAITLSMTYPY